MLAQHDHSATLISEVITSSGEKVSSPEVDAFSQYYSSLSTSSLPSGFHPGYLSVLLDQVELEWLSDRELEVLVCPITSEEVLMAIGSFPSGKAPGPDGLPIEFYKTHGDVLAPKLAVKCLRGLSLIP